MSGKYALIVANTEYLDPNLSKLTAPGKDANDFAAILRDKEICAFDDVTTLINEPEHIIRGAIDELFNQKRSDDLLVLYFSGHGIRDELGALYLAVHNTLHTRLRSTAIKSDYIREAMDQSLSNRQVLILDCCNSGAFAQGTKAATGTSIGTGSAFEGTGYGRVVLTASDATQLAWEGNQIIGETENSLFTHFLIQGLKGEADRDQDGKITVDDLYVYTYDQIIKRTQKQTPRKWSYKQQGEIPLRQLTESQREKLRLLELEKIQKQEQEERDQLERLRAERETIEKLALELQTTKETAMMAIAQERAKREKMEQEIKTQRTAQGIRGISQNEIQESTATPQVRKRQYQAWLFGSAVVVVGLLLFLRSGAFQNIRSAWSPTEPPIFTPQALTFEPPATPQVQINTPIVLSSAKISPDNAVNVVQLARWGKGVINEAIYSPDGKTIALASSIGIYLFDTVDLQEKLFIETRQSIQSITFTQDNKNIIAISNYGEFLKFRLEDGAFETGSKVDFPYFVDAKSSPNASLAAISGGPSQTKIYIADLATGDIFKILEPNDLSVPYEATLRDMSFSSDGNMLVSCTNEGIYLWNPNNGELIRKIQIKQDNLGGYYVYKVIFSPDNTKIAYRLNMPNSYSSTVSIFNTLDGSLIRTFEEGNDIIGALAFSPDSQDLYYGKSNGSIVAQRINDGSLLQTLNAHTQTISHVAFAPNGLSFISTSDDGSIKLWHKDTSALVNSASGFVGENNDIDISVSPDNKLVISNQNGNATIWDIAHGKIVQTISNPDHWISFSRFLSTRLTIAMTGMTESSNILELWDYQENNLTKVSETDAQAWDSDTVAISPDDQFLAIDREEYSIYLFVLGASSDYTSLYPFILKGHTKKITDIAFSPNSTLLASGSADETIRIWSVTSTSSISKFTDHTDWINGVAFSPDGTVLASSSEDGTILFQRVDNGKIINTIGPLTDKKTPNKLVFSPDGQILAFSSYDGNIQLLSVSTGNILQTLSGHTWAGQKLQFTSDGKLLISSSYDGTIRIWGIKP